MVIDPNNGLNGTSSSVRNRNSSAISTDTGAAPARKQSAPATGDLVSLSGEAHTMNRLEAQIKASPDVNAERVAKIKEAIANGSFEINAERIAERMLSSDDLLG